MATPLGAVLPWTGGDFRGLDGLPLAAGKVFFYEAGTSTKTDTWSDSDLSTANTNPVILDSAGRATIFLGPTTYKVIVATSTASDPPVGAQIIRTIDGVAASTSLTNTNIPFTAGESIAAGQWIYMSDGSGSLTAGRWYLTDADEVYKSVTAKQIAISNDTLSAGETGTAFQSGEYTLISGTVTAGTDYYLSATAGAITSTAPTNARKVATANTTTTLLVSFWQPTAFYEGVMPGGISATAVGNVGAGEDTLKSFTVSSDYGSAGTYRFTCSGTTAANANTKRIKVYVDGVAVLDTTAIALDDQAWTIDVVVSIRSAISNGATIFSRFIPSAPAAGINVLVASSSVETVSPPFVFAITGESVSVPATDDIIQHLLIVEKLA